MKIKCIECESIHKVNGWISLFQNTGENLRCEFHITCSCNNRMTVEHEHEVRRFQRKIKNITTSIGCDIIGEDFISSGIRVDYSHNIEDVLSHYYTEAVYEKWNTPESVEYYT